MIIALLIAFIALLIQLYIYFKPVKYIKQYKVNTVTYFHTSK